KRKRPADPSRLRAIGTDRTAVGLGGEIKCRCRRSKRAEPVETRNQTSSPIIKENHHMKMSFCSHCQSLIIRIQQSRTAPRPRLRRRPSWMAESLEARALLSSTPAMVADINPGGASSAPSQNQMVAIGSTTYFVADDGVHGQEVWKSNGTAAGTSMLAD